MNESLNRVIDLYVEGDSISNIEGLKQALNQRENELVDALREAANEMGLAPSITQLTLLRLGLGDAPDQEYVDLIHRQAHEEVERHNAQALVIQAALDAYQQGGSG